MALRSTSGMLSIGERRCTKAIQPKNGNSLNWYISLRTKIFIQLCVCTPFQQFKALIGPCMYKYARAYDDSDLMGVLYA